MDEVLLVVGGKTHYYGPGHWLFCSRKCLEELWQIPEEITEEEIATFYRQVDYEAQYPEYPHRDECDACHGQLSWQPVTDLQRELYGREP